MLLGFLDTESSDLEPGMPYALLGARPSSEDGWLRYLVCLTASSYQKGWVGIEHLADCADGQSS